MVFDKLNEALAPPVKTVRRIPAANGETTIGAGTDDEPELTPKRYSDGASVDREFITSVELCRT
jgi:hypothetical protein